MLNNVERWERNCPVLRQDAFRSKYELIDEVIGEGGQFSLVCSICDEFAGCSKPHGLGSFGTVISATDRRMKEKRAVKVIRRLRKVSFLLIELQLITQLGGNFNVIKFYDFFHAGGSISIVMEHFEHCTVSELLLNSRKDKSFGLQYFRNLLLALAYLHDNKFVHRDVKLSNFLCNPKTMRFRLVDFGLATVDRTETEMNEAMIKRQLEDSPECNVCSRERTLCLLCRSKANRDTYTAVGTPGIRAPEVLFGVGLCGSPLDIFSAGLCLLSLVTLKHPFFMPTTEIENIANLSSLVGSDTLEKMAHKEGLRVAISPKSVPLDFNKLIVCTRYGLDVVTRCPEWASSKFCSYCAELFYNNENGYCICRDGKGKFSTDGLDRDLAILYVDLLYRSLEVDRKERYTAQQLLRMIEFYDRRCQPDANKRA